ncbi:hypothetical protein CAEBREN_29966, partial [Caenorhabditis brenneri]
MNPQQMSQYQQMQQMQQMQQYQQSQHYQQSQQYRMQMQQHQFDVSTNAIPTSILVSIISKVNFLPATRTRIP